MKLENTWQTSGLEKLISYIIKAANQPEILDDLNYATDATWSSNKIKTVLDQLKLDIDSDIDDVAKALSKIKIELVTVEPTNDNTVSGTIYIYQNATDNKYYQYLRTETVLVNLGEASADLTKYYTKTDADAKFALASDLTTTNTEVAKKLNKTSVIASTDTTTSAGEDNVYSAKKVDSLIDEVDPSSLIDDTTTSDETTYSSDKINNLVSSKADYSSIIDNWQGNGYNLILYPYSDGTSKTLNGITFTVNHDGTINVSGTATEETGFYMIRYTKDFKLENGKTYALSGGLSTATLQLFNGTWSFSMASHGETTTKVCTVDNVLQFRVLVKSGDTVDGVVKPMLVEVAEDGSYPTEYQRYAKSNVELTDTLSGYSNPNLLDNPWFTVNQRGQTSYTTPGYTVDRWKNSNEKASLTVNSNNTITLTKNTTTDDYDFVQYIKNHDILIGKTYTLSIMLSDGTILSNTGTIIDDSTQRRVITVPIDGFGTVFMTSVPANNRQNIAIRGSVANASITVKAVKLELGSVSTLANDVAPNYATELLKCQRYYQKIVRSPIAYSGYANETTSFRATLPLTVPMRTKPTLVNSSITLGECLIYTPSGSSITPTAIAISDWYPTNGNCLQLNSTASGLTKNVCGVQRFNVDLELSADL